MGILEDINAGIAAIHEASKHVGPHVEFMSPSEYAWRHGTKPFDLWSFLALCWLDIERRAVIQRIDTASTRIRPPPRGAL